MSQRKHILTQGKALVEIEDSGVDTSVGSVATGWPTEITLICRSLKKKVYFGQEKFLKFALIDSELLVYFKSLHFAISTSDLRFCA